MGDIDEISHTIGRLESKVDHLIETTEKFTEKFEQHDDRLKTIEGYKNYGMGVIAVITFVFTMAIEFVKERIFKGA